MSETSSLDPALNLWTIASIAIVAYCLVTVLHEAMGHGGACLLLGGHPKSLNADSFGCDKSSVSTIGWRIIGAGGTIVNLITGGLALAILRFKKPQLHSFQYFLWLFSAVSLLSAFGYLLFSGVTGIGDWIAVVRNIIPNIIARILLVVIGAVLYFWLTPKLLVPEFKHFLSGSIPLNLQIFSLLRFPYVIGGTTVLVAGLLNPHISNVLFVSAAISAFAATSLLAWYPHSKIHSTLASLPTAPLTIRASWSWILAGSVTLLFFVGILGQGIIF